MSEPEKSNILVVDDLQEKLLAYQAVLEELGQNVITACSGAEALKLVLRHEFAVILLDVNMPGMDGFETATLIRGRKRSAHTPIIFLTAFADDMHTALGYAHGAVDYLPTPVVPEVLRAKVKVFVDLFQMQQRAAHQAEQLQLLIEGTVDYAIIMLDAAGHVSTWNAGAERITGYHPEEVIGRHFSCFYTSSAVERGWPEHELEIARSQGRFEDEGWRARKDGSQFWANVVIAALRDTSGRLLGFSKITRDLTERRRSEDTLRQAHAELERRVLDRTAELSKSRDELERQSQAMLSMLEDLERERVGLDREIHERKRAEAAARKSEERFRTTVESAPTGMVMIDRDGRIVLVNAQTLNLFGYERSELLGRPVEMLVPERFRGGHPQLRLGYFAAPGARRMGAGRDLYGLRKDGTEFPVEIGLNPIEMEEGLFVLSTIADITERKRAEAAAAAHADKLREVADRTRLILANALDAFIAMDVEGAIIAWNRQAESMFGWSQPEALGRRLAELVIPPRQRQAHADGLARFLATGEGPVLNKRIEITALHRTGLEFPVEISVTPVRAAEGLFFDAFVRDITERKAAEEALTRRAAELADTNTQLLRSNQELDEFAYVASHDLREPLRGIHNYATFLMEDYGRQFGDDGRLKLETLQRLAARMDTLIDSLLQFSRVGRLDLAMHPTNLNDLVTEVVDSLRFTLDERKVEVRLPQLLPTLPCDKVRVGEVLSNLIGNAVKYNDKPQPWVEIGTLADHGGNGAPAAESGPCVFYVRDNGIGIHPKHHDAIFRIFKRLHGRDKYGGGAGAGLTIVKKIVERHGGRIWVASAPGEGSTFYFTLQKGTPAA